MRSEPTKPVAIPTRAARPCGSPSATPDAMVSNTHDRDVKRREIRLEKSYQRQWWQSGDLMPDRAPGWGNVVQGAD